MLLPTACDRPGEKADALAQQAAQLADAGDMLGAMTAIQQAIGLRDDNAGYFLMLASINLRAGRPVDGYLAGQRALELDAANVDALTLVANIGMQIGQLDDAHRAADRLLTLDPNSLIGLQIKGLYNLYRNKLVEADATAQRLLTLNPSDIAGIIIHTRVLAKDKKMEEALAFLEEKMNQSTASAPLLITQINLYRALGRGEDMARVFTQLGQLVPERSTAMRLDEINVLYRLGRTDQARSATQAVLASRATSVNDLNTLQRLWSEYDRVPFTSETIKAAQEWSEPVTLLAIGRYLLWQNEPQLADDMYFSASPAVRDIAMAIHLRAALRLGRPDVAQGTIGKLLSIDPDNVDGLLLRSELEAAAGNMTRAIEAAQKALNNDQTDPEVYVALGRLHARAGSTSLARDAFEDGFKQMPQNYFLIEQYAQFLHESGNKSRAVSATRAFARALPSSVRAWTIMAQQCAWAGDAACAAEAAAGRTAAAKRFVIDDTPGAPPDRGLLGKF